MIYHLYHDTKIFLSTGNIADLTSLDLAEALNENPAFESTLHALNRYLWAGLREIVLRPAVEDVNGLIKNLIEEVEGVNRTTDAKSRKHGSSVLTGIKGSFINAGQKCLTQLLESRAVTQEQVNSLYTMIMEVAAVQVRPHLVREALSRSKRVQDKLQQRRIPIWRMKYLTDDTQTDSFRLQVIVLMCVR